MRRFVLLDHVCRVCYGRLVAEISVEGKRTGKVRCSDCGLEESGDYRALCCCGLKLRNGKDAGFRCVLNLDITPEMPAEIIVKHVDE